MFLPMCPDFMDTLHNSSFKRIHREIFHLEIRDGVSFSHSSRKEDRGKRIVVVVVALDVYEGIKL